LIVSQYEGIGLQTKYLIGLVMVTSILVASFAGFELSYFEFQPQIESTKTELSQLNSKVTRLQSQNAVLNSTVTELRSNLSAMWTNYAILQSKNLALNETVEALNRSVDGLRLNVSALDTYCGALRSENAVLNVTVTELNSSVDSLRSSVSTLEAKCGMLQSQNAVLNETVNELNRYIDNISFVTDSSYYIFKQNSTYYAKSGLTGEIECHNESCSVVVNYALAHVPYGGAVLFEPLASPNDTYYIDGTIYPLNGTTLASENRMVTISLDKNTNQTIIDLNNVHDVQIRNIGIYGNKWDNATGDGIVIEGNYSGSNELIENVVITNCNGTGIWVQHNRLNNAFINVQVFDSEAYNIRVDSSDNQFIDSESGWAGLSGFYAPNGDNYFLNCISWGCGMAGNRADCNGFSIRGARNMLIGCDGSANYGGGFVLDNAYQSLLGFCIARNNGRTADDDRIPGRWGFDLWNTNYTILSGCVSTDENEQNKTQDYGFTEGGYSDYNIVTCCNFDGNNVGAVFDLAGIHSVIMDTLGYETENLRLSNFNVPSWIAVGTNGTFGNATDFPSSKETIADFHVTISWFNVSRNENVTVRVQALMANGTTTLFQTSKNDNETYILTEEDLAGLWSKESSSNPIVQLQISAETTENSTVATVSVFVWGSGG
jgi:prefoldin subunit 5